MSISISTHDSAPYQDKLDPWSSHSIIARFLKEYPPGTRILDVGTATGMIGRLCRECGFYLAGVEPVAAWATESQPYYAKISVKDLAHTEDAFLSGYHVVVCADVLEHMPDPEIQLKRLVHLQSPGTRFFISLPNVANLWVRMNLLLGRFDYTERGILDRTHMRFFTLNTALEMVNASGLQIEQVRPTPIPLNLVSPFFQSWLGRGVHAALAGITRLLRGLFGYQFVFSAIKRP